MYNFLNWLQVVVLLGLVGCMMFLSEQLKPNTSIWLAILYTVILIALCLGMVLTCFVPIFGQGRMAPPRRVLPIRKRAL